MWRLRSQYRLDVGRKAGLGMVISTEVRCGQTMSEHEVSTSDDLSIRIERDDIPRRASLLVVARVQEKAK
jgi:hypothetical protein